MEEKFSPGGFTAALLGLLAFGSSLEQGSVLPYKADLLVAG